MLKRITHVRPGYDCIAKPCGERGCGTLPGSSHGRHGDEWHYAVSDGDVAISLCLNTNRFPSGFELHMEPVRPSLIVGHAAFPTGSDAREQIRNGSALVGSSDCPFIQPACFTTDAWFNRARLVFGAGHGVPTLEQPESLWLALEAEWRGLAPGIREARVDSLVPCSACGGSGVCERKST